MTILTAKYRCKKCGYEFDGQPGPTKCTKCNNEYVKWLNYEEMKKRWVNTGNDLFIIEFPKEVYEKMTEEEFNEWVKFNDGEIDIRDVTPLPNNDVMTSTAHETK